MRARSSGNYVLQNYQSREGQTLEMLILYHKWSSRPIKTKPEEIENRVNLLQFDAFAEK